MELILFACAAALYVAATLAALVYLYLKNERVSILMYHLLVAGVVVHLASFGLRLELFWKIPENRYFAPISSFYGALSFLSLAVAVVFAVVEGRHRLGILGAFVLPWAAAGAVGAWWRALYMGGTEIHGLAPALQSYWMNIHPMVLMAAYAIFANAFGVGLALLVQEAQVKSRKPTELCYRLPAIEDLDDLNYRCIVTGFPVLTVGILMGGIWAYGAWGRFWGWDPKETWSLITALVYAAYLHMRSIGGWRGRKSVYMSMVGFACVLFTFIGVNFLSGLHGYLSSNG
ncbi:MAG: c-type cytochrome biogenesis protein CcsB [Elusimicrobia bacterium]|nr:c-type cytochrome biogenesis protein CcsB [Elusimicrobiota bacterium]